MRNYNIICNDTSLLISDHILELIKYLKSAPLGSIRDLVSLLEITRLKRRTVYIIGNGGSAATALHMTNDLVSINFHDQCKIKANCLSSNISIFSAIANDIGYEHVFDNQLASVIEADDVVIGISASGNSKNCINAFKLAKSKGAFTVGLVGFSGGELLNISDYSVHIAVNDYYLVESIHMAISHTIAHALRSQSINHIENSK